MCIIHNAQVDAPLGNQRQTTVAYQCTRNLMCVDIEHQRWIEIPLPIVLQPTSEGALLGGIVGEVFSVSVLLAYPNS